MDIDTTAIKALTMYSIRTTVLGKKVYVPLLITVFLAIVMFYGSLDDGRLVMGINMMDSLIISFFSVLISMVYGTSVINDVVEDKSIINVLTAPIHRSTIFLTYYFSAFVSVSFVMLFVTTVAYMAYFVPAGLTWFRFDYFIAILWLVLFSSLVYSALFVTVSFTLKKPVYFGLFYVFVWEGFVGALPGKIKEFTINHFIRSLGSLLIDHGEISRYSGASLGTAIVVLILVWISLLALGSFMFAKKEFP